MSKPSDSETTDPNTKQSRRQFAKTIAAALVAVPAVAALTSCNSGGGNNNNGTVTPTPTPSPTPRTIQTQIEFTGSEPPVIMDGGSCEITSLVDFTPKSGSTNHFEFKPGQTTYKGVKGVNVTNEYGSLLKSYTVSASQTLTVNVWYGAVKSISGDDVDYDAPETDPQVVLTAKGDGSSFDLYAVEGLGTRHHEFTGRKLGKKYTIDKWKGGREFHLAKVQVLVDGSGDLFTDAGQGFRIAIIFNP
jgi:hypothetical protein